MYSRTGRAAGMFLLALVCGWWGARPAGAQSPPANFVALKSQMKVFEAVVDGNMAQVFAPPFGLLEKTLGTYLPGFGLAFSLEVNLYPSRSFTLFSPPSRNRFHACWPTMPAACAALPLTTVWRSLYTFLGRNRRKTVSPCNWSLRLACPTSISFGTGRSPINNC